MSEYDQFCQGFYQRRCMFLKNLPPSVCVILGSAWARKVRNIGWHWKNEESEKAVSDALAMSLFVGISALNCGLTRLPEHDSRVGEAKMATTLALQHVTCDLPMLAATHAINAAVGFINQNNYESASAAHVANYIVEVMGPGEWVWLYKTYLWAKGPEGLKFDPAWRTEPAAALARWILLSDDDFSVMPILADALQDAGCTHEGLIEHLQNDFTWTKADWVLWNLVGLKDGR